MTTQRDLPNAIGAASVARSVPEVVVPPEGWLLELVVPPVELGVPPECWVVLLGLVEPPVEVVVPPWELVAPPVEFAVPPKLVFPPFMEVPPVPVFSPILVPLVLVLPAVAGSTASVH